MGFFDALTGARPAQQAQGIARPGLSKEANEFLNVMVEVQGRTPPGQRASAADIAKMGAAALKVTTDDHIALRQYAANNMKATLQPMTRDPNPETSKAAKGLIGMIDGGILPGIEGKPTVWIKSGQPATGDEVQAAKAKGWAAK